MCELFGLSSNRPVLPGELLRRFRERGGNTADNPDGWGLATLDDGAFRLWIAFEPGELRVYRAGRRIARFITHPRAMAPAPDGDLPRTNTIVSDNGRPTPRKNGASP